MLQRKDLFDFMMRRVKQTGDIHGDRLAQAFGRWFANMYYPGVIKITISDASGDGKVDLFVTCQVGKTLRYQILNTKYTSEYDKGSPVSFYDEITRYWQAFENKANRADYLKTAVRESFREQYKKLFRLYDEDSAQLYFVTNHRINQKQYDSVKNYGIKIFHLDDVLQYVAEHIEGAMPETEPMLLSGIANVLTPATNESEVPTSIVFARLIDFMKYMDNDPFELLFARNVRLWLGNTEPNKEIQKTFRDSPKEFAYSNNGITILCKKHTYDPGKQELRLENPRVVNGSQTLHSIRNVDNPSHLARVMVRIIELAPAAGHDLPSQVTKRKDVIHKISIRSNLQNPIKRWNLVSNDDFQNELSRYFWSRKIYYERREFEWRHRKLELSSVGLTRGPDIRWMTQLVAAYNYDLRKLGPAAAQGQLNTLFEEEPYSVIRDTSPEKVFQLYLIGEILEMYLKKLRGKKKYIENVYRYIEFTVFSVICKIIRELNIRLGDETYEQHLNMEYEQESPQWEQLIKQIIDHILLNYRCANMAVWRRDRTKLTHANYFKNRSMINELMNAKVPRKIVNGARSLLIPQ
jgi:hypothetical protein